MKFLGRSTQEEVIRILQDSDIFILPSLNEGMSNSILEAMACGLPIITTDTGGADELVSSNGFIIQKASIPELEDAIRKFIDDKDLAQSLGENSRKLAEKMSWNSMASDYHKIY